METMILEQPPQTKILKFELIEYDKKDNLRVTGTVDSVVKIDYALTYIIKHE